MRHRINRLIAGKRTSQGKMLQKNIASSLILHNKIVTTTKKARLARSLVERVITLSQKSDLHSQRRIGDLLKNKEAAKKVRVELSKKYKDKPGGYSRILKLDKRLGDNANMVQIELI